MPVCQTDFLDGSVTLDPDQVQFDQGLRTAWVRDVEITVGGFPTGVPGPGVDGGDGGGDDGNPGYVDPFDPGRGGDPHDPGMGGDPYDPGMGEPVSETMTVSLEFTGTGTLTTSAYHGPMCGDGERQCVSHRRTATRTATGTLTVLDLGAVSGPAQLEHLSSLDIPRPDAWSRTAD